MSIIKEIKYKRLDKYQKYLLDAINNSEIIIFNNKIYYKFNKEIIISYSNETYSLVYSRMFIGTMYDYFNNDNNKYTTLLEINKSVNSFLFKYFNCLLIHLISEIKI